jgi:hypothetical protein
MWPHNTVDKEFVKCNTKVYSQVTQVTADTHV